MSAARDPALVVMRCRTSDRSPNGARGAAALGRALGACLGRPPRLIGQPEPARSARYDADLRASRGCLLEAGGQVDDALAAGALPVLVAGDCSVCVATLPAVVARRPDVRVLWLDAHADFNTPDTTPSGFLGGMCLAAACGRWESGFPGTLDPGRVAMVGVRDVDPGERAALDLAGVGRLRPGEAAEALRGQPMFAHVDLDVLDPTVLPAGFPAPGGLSLEGLGRLLAEVAAAAEVVGLEVAGFPAADDPALTARVADALAPLAGA